MAPQGFCPDCGSKQPANAPDGLCPHCLLRLGLGEGASLGRPGEEGTGRTDELTAEHLHRSARRSSAIAEDSRASGILMALDQSIGPVPRVLLRDGPADARLVRPRSPEMPDTNGQPGRYHLVGEVARGGMGVILKGRDVDLGRDLAIKVILEEHRDAPEIVRRFVEEAQIGGQLQHPGIVPVHELGRFPDGRLYIAMKLIRGRTLAALLLDRGGLIDDRPRFLSIFEQVCQTMAYAHARGVVHRDLKPSNVMAGDFGEVHVMDWGLAKVLDEGGVADEMRAKRGRDEAIAIRTFRTGSGAGESLAGSVLGTPAYMAPEQARGEIDTVDERADVFGLGSILCEILSGQPAYAGRTGLELYRMAERADVQKAFDRLDACGADAELIQLAKSCLRAAPRDRPRDAGAVLAGLNAYLAGAERRLREAGLAKARAETLAAEERKRRTLSVALAASVLVTGLLGAGGWAWFNNERARRIESVHTEVNRALDSAAIKRLQARSVRGSDRTLWVQAIETARRAESLLSRAEGDAELRERVRVVLSAIEREREEVESSEKDRRMVERLAEIHNDLGVHHDSKRVDAEYSAAFRNYGVDLDAGDPAAAGARLAKSPVAVELANALDQWVFIRRISAWREPPGARREPPGPRFTHAPRTDPPGARRLVEVAEAADPEPWRNQLRETLGRMTVDPAHALDDLERLAATAKLDRLPEASVTRLASALSSLGRREMAIALLRRTQAAHPDDFWVNADLGRELFDSGRHDEAVRFFAVAVGIRPRSDLALRFLGKALQCSGQLAEAADTFRRMIALRPDDAHARVELGAVLLKSGDTRAADAEFGEAKRLKSADWKVCDMIGSARADAGDWSAAIQERHEAVQLEPYFPFTHNALGFALLAAGRTDLAILSFREAIRIDARCGPAYLGLGRALLAQGEFREALDVIGRGDLGMHPPDRSLDPAALATKAERMIALDARLPAFLRGEGRPIDAKESAEFAQLCFSKGLYADSARLWSEAFAARPALGGEPGSENYYQAARAAAMASRGNGKIGEGAAAAASRWRDRALVWMKEELAAAASRFDSATARERSEIPKRLGRWQVDPTLSVLQGESAAKALNEPERQSLREFWSGVASLMQKAKTAGTRDVLSRSF
jgi:eukaryotic-like serine/threonine-protein kinase